ncbi:exosortase J [Edaphobacter aggregans]|uniref:Exosortase J n=1 Tax=Edaphobacter aggregans TaxID=570835 RepID=A0A428MKN4_9BACT|nr:exosortase J [Edaphobacter aggregans]RSL17495.1 exosortase J [Edaphobacter aggregans]
MSTLPAADLGPYPMPRVARLSPPYAAGFAAILAILGVCSIWSTAAALWTLWSMDALKSIGMMVPLVSLVLILRVWRSQNWQMEGSWWGLVVLTVTIAAVHIRDQAVLILVVSPKWAVYFPPHSLVAFAYGAGVVLLFGGPRLFRAALFPIVLLWFVNPIPHFFNVLVDLPLQRVSAHVARAFAIALGQPLSPDQMRLMFTPTFGMFIAPGCNGIRGAVTMGFIALIAGYVYRFRWYAHAAVVAGAVLLGYLFNFVRLCTLVLYYIVALHFHWLRSRAEMGDYIIGACLFLVATLLLFYVVRRLGESPRQTKPVLSSSPFSSTSRWSYKLRFAAMFLIATFGCYGFARAVVIAEATGEFAQIRADQRAPGKFPPRMGAYTLVRTWNENLNTGTLLFHWAEYAPVNGGAHINLGISPVLGTHDTLICHSARGDDPIWQNELTTSTAGQPNVSFNGAMFNNSTSLSLEATTVCSGSSCGEYATDRSHFGFVYSKPNSQSLLTQDPQRPIPIMLRTELGDDSLPADYARQQMSASLSTFLASVDLNELTRPYRHR